MNVGLFVALVLPVAVLAWNYQDDEGPNVWKNSYPICGRSQQSPVDIDPTKSIFEAKLSSPFVFGNYDKPYSSKPVKIKNNGHSIEVDILQSADVPVIVRGGGLPGTYRGVQLHFHWGSTNNQGSEHTVNGRKYPIELHIVHYNTDRFREFGDAVAQSEGLAVLGVFLEITKEDNPALSPITDAIKTLAVPGSSTWSTTALELDELLPKSTHKFYRYSGSLTTPPCFESVVWTVFQDPVGISENQLMEFRRMFDSDKNHMENNYRPPLSMNGRTLYSSTSTKTEL
ncbi:unnamed protein product [Owenia fusiformis]|uniref:Carbonic anhydrase n=1 Tax=Owenia fusiformis TaxID=6347 RepID=A0A8J1Y7R9_OWEFU|nr:unnamed protein product [Owenia fusiformis]